MELKNFGLMAGALALGMLVFGGANAVWTAVDGKERPGSGLAVAGEVLAKLPNPFRKDPSAYLLPPLPEIEGWDRREIADPWTVRPIRMDGAIPTDEEMRVWLARRFPGETDPIPTGLNTQELKDRRARADGAKRAAANYSNGEVAFNVVIERLPDPDEVNPDALGPFGRILYEGVGILELAHNLAQRRTVIAGVPFVLLNGAGEGTQQSDPEARIGLESIREGNALRIWGTGNREDVERLLLAFRATVKPHPMAKGLD